jgi:amylosucrase
VIDKAARGSTDRDRRARAAAALTRLRPRLAAAARSCLDRGDAVAFLARVEVWFADAHAPLDELYGERLGGDTAVDGFLGELLGMALRAAAARPTGLRELDRRREAAPDWYQDQRMVGYVAYVDRFAGSLTGLHDRLDHLAELGVGYLHLMPLLAPREGANDGGYAVRDYRSVDRRLGTMDELSELAAALRSRGISLCIDMVLNHTAREHPWARAWLAGDPDFAGFYTVFGDRTMPDAIEATVSDVFPHAAPGSFTRVPEAGGWVWTTFFDYQWDLDYTNPRVFAAVLDTVLWLANRGVEVFRMDAVPFMGKRVGTSCLNQPEVHLLVQALHALVKPAAPGTAFKAEAIVAPDELVPYLGGHERYRPECELAYHNQLMVMLWSSLATKDARLATRALRRLPAIPTPTSWATYVRCHDDIGWAVADADARAVGYDPFAHRDFLNAFYAGEFPLSYARGARFGRNPQTGDARISGSAAALCGIQDARARSDAHALELGIRRLVLLHAVAYGWGGLPLLYMGDELAQGNDDSYLDDPALAGDNRWMHRPHFDTAAAARRRVPGTVEGRVFGWLVALAAARRDQPALHAAGAHEVLDLGAPTVLGWRRRHPRSGWFVGLANFAEHEAEVDLAALGEHAALETVIAADGPPPVRAGRLVLPALGWAWLAEP